MLAPCCSRYVRKWCTSLSTSRSRNCKAPLWGALQFLEVITQETLYLYCHFVVLFATYKVTVDTAYLLARHFFVFVTSLYLIHVLIRDISVVCSILILLQLGPLAFSSLGCREGREGYVRHCEMYVRHQYIIYIIILLHSVKLELLKCPKKSSDPVELPIPVLT